MREIAKKTPERATLFPSIWDDNPFLAMQNFMNEWLSTRPFAATKTERPSTFSPEVDLADDGECYRLTAELPGLDEKDVKLTLSAAGDAVILEGEKKHEREEKKKDYYWAERSYGMFRRSVPLPGAVDASKIEATFKKGLLNVTLPKDKAAPQSRNISIKT